MRIHFWSLMMLSLLGWPPLYAGSAPVSSGEGSAPLRLEDVLAEVDRRNPEIRAARKRWEAARARIGPAGTWPSPSAGYSRERTPAGEKMSHTVLEQEIPFPGKLSAEARMRRHEARIAEAEHRARALAARSRARGLYYKIFRSDRLAALLSENVAAMRSILRAMEARLSSGEGMGGRSTGSELFAMQSELGRMEGMLLEERQGRILAAIELNALLDRDPGVPVGPALPPELIDLPRDMDGLLRSAEGSPLYQSAVHERSHARAMLTRSRLDFAPDFGLMYDRQAMEDGRTGREAGISLRVPLWWRRPVGSLREARTHAEEAEAMSDSMHNEVRKMVAMEFTETGTHLALARHYRAAVIPPAESALRLARREYESGRGDFVRLLEAFRTLLAAERDYADELYHYGEHWGLLEQWVGAPLNAEEGMRRAE